MPKEERVVLISLDSVDENQHDILSNYAENYFEISDQVLVLTVYNYQSINTPYFYTSDEPLVNADLWRQAVKESMDHVHKQLNKAREFLVSCGLKNSQIDTYFRETNDNAGQCICNVVDELAPDLVIIGKHNRGALSRTIIGSTSTYVIHHVKKPTILVNLPC